MQDANVYDYILVQVIPMRMSAVFSSAILRSLAAIFLLVSIAVPKISGAEPPRIVQQNGRFALMVDGKPYLILGGQIHNSSAWPSELPQVWKSMEVLHANTIEVPIYWEQLEAEPARFDYTNVDAIVNGAREHHLRAVLLWFGTWKNGNMHYAPAWVKADTARYPRIVRPDGQPIDVLSPLSRNTLNADKNAFTALMRH